MTNTSPETRRENLALLATYLEQLPADYTHFHMSHFFYDWTTCHLLERRKFTTFDFLTDPQTILNTCGTVACSLGHGPAAGIPMNVLPENFDSMSSWSQYADLFSSSYEEYEWLFSGAWSAYDNSHRGAAARIRWLLDGRPIPHLGTYPNEDAVYSHAAVALYQEFVVQ